MATTRFADHLLSGTHAARPSASAVPAGTLYACSTHNKIYQSDGSSTWSDWSVASSGVVATDTIWDTKGDLAAATGADAASKLAAGTDNYVLIADSAQSVGLKWGVAPPFILNTQTASYTLVLGDAGKLVGMNVGSANTLTVPTNASVAYPTGTQVTVRQVGAGQTSVAGDTGVTVSSRGSALKLAGQYAYASLVKVATDTWELTGDITT